MQIIASHTKGAQHSAEVDGVAVPLLQGRIKGVDTEFEGRAIGLRANVKVVCMVWGSGRGKSKAEQSIPP